MSKQKNTRHKNVHDDVVPKRKSSNFCELYHYENVRENAIFDKTLQYVFFSGTFSRKQ